MNIIAQLGRLAAQKQAADFPPLSGIWNSDATPYKHKFPVDGRQAAIDRATYLTEGTDGVVRRLGSSFGRSFPVGRTRGVPLTYESLDSRLDKITPESDPWFDYMGTHGVGQRDSPWTLRALERRARKLRQPRLLQGGPSGPSHPGPPREVGYTHVPSRSFVNAKLDPGESINPRLQKKLDAGAIYYNRPLPELDGPNTEEPLLPAPHPFNNPNSPSYRPSGPSTAAGPALPIDQSRAPVQGSAADSSSVPKEKPLPPGRRGDD